MGQLVARALPLAVGGAVSPVLLVAVVLILSGADRPRLRAFAFAVGNVAALVALTVLVATLFRSIGHVGTGPNTTGAVIDLTLGALLLLYGLGRLGELAFHQHHPVTGADPDLDGGGGDPDPGDPPSDARRGGVVGALALGFALMATNVSTVALYLAALKDVAQARVTGADRLVTVVVVIAVIMVPVVVPLVLTVVAPKRSTRILAGVHGFVVRHRAAITGGFVTVFGVLLLVKGVRGA
jgi:hypothetical protein